MQCRPLKFYNAYRFLGVECLDLCFERDTQIPGYFWMDLLQVVDHIVYGDYIVIYIYMETYDVKSLDRSWCRCPSMEFWTDFSVMVCTFQIQKAMEDEDGPVILTASAHKRVSDLNVLQEKARDPSSLYAETGVSRG